MTSSLRSALLLTEALAAPGRASRLARHLAVGKHTGLLSQHLSCGPCLLMNQERWASSSAENGNGSMDKQIKENIKQIRKGNFGAVTDPQGLKHFRTSKPSQASPSDEATRQDTGEDIPAIGTYTLPHPIWDEKDMHEVKVTHKKPEGIVDKLAYNSVKLTRGAFDLLSGFNRGERNEKVWINRICFLETVAGVPGMVAAMTRHLDSLRRMRRDHGWIHTLLEEAENERMHLMTALQLKQPSLTFRWGVVLTQGVFVAAFSAAYLISPRFCHRFVGYLEEEAVLTYSKCLKDIDSGPMQHWKTQPAPDVAIRYWQLPADAVMLDVILAIRADEAHHRIVNHTLASMKKDDFNPYKPGE